MGHIFPVTKFTGTFKKQKMKWRAAEALLFSPEVL